MGKLWVEGVRYNVNPCPFCGRYDKLEFTKRENYESNYDRSGSAVVAIHCTRCNLDMYKTAYKVKCYDAKMSILIDKWNNRCQVSFIDSYRKGCSTCTGVTTCPDAYTSVAQYCNGERRV